MNLPFKITYSWQAREDPEAFDPNDYVDWSSAIRGLWHFLSLYKGEFVVQVGMLQLYFDFDPDLSTVWEELPSVLDQLKTGTDAPVELDFFEPGTDVAWVMQRQGETILLHFRSGISVGRQFQELPENHFQVSATEFLAEWQRFIQAVLEAITTVQPDLLNDNRYQLYRAHFT